MDIEKFLDSLVKNKTVLEVGGLGDIISYKQRSFKNLRSIRLYKLASYFVGVDINLNAIETFRDSGYNYYYYGNIENYNSLPLEIVNRKYDIVLMLDVIEHLNNIGNALSTINKLLKTKGIVVISTPNPFSLRNLLKVIAGKQPSEYHEHVCYIGLPHFTELFRRTGFNFKEYYYFSFDAHYSLMVNFKTKLIKLIAQFNKLFNTHLLVIGEKFS